tara:strand:- start:797 stop:1072 length:276 start_codon:yes stop_codon:yes gene_type:complete
MALPHVRSVTKHEMLLAVAMSQYFEKTHVLFIPPNTHYVGMLKTLERKKLVEKFTTSFYRLTPKGILRLKYVEAERAKEADRAIDEFVDKL